MRRTLLPAVLALFLASCASDGPTDTAGPPIEAISVVPITLARVGVGEHLRIEEESRGCFHHWKSDVTLDRAGPPGLERHEVVTDLESRRSGESPITRVIAGEFTPEEVAHLDRYFARLRLPQEGMCTTQSTFRLRLFQGDSLLREELLQDRICAAIDDGFETIPPPPVVDSGEAQKTEAQGYGAGTSAS